jgi:hypothetical protein
MLLAPLFVCRGGKVNRYLHLRADAISSKSLQFITWLPVSVQTDIPTRRVHMPSVRTDGLARVPPHLCRFSAIKTGIGLSFCTHIPAGLKKVEERLAECEGPDGGMLRPGWFAGGCERSHGL